VYRCELCRDRGLIGGDIPCTCEQGRRYLGKGEDQLSATEDDPQPINHMEDPNTLLGRVGGWSS